MTILRVIDKNNELPVYPLPLDATLTRNDWWQFNGAKLFTPDFLARVPDHLQGYAVRLWDHAMREGDPAGTLPCQPRELGVIVARHHDTPACEELRRVVLADWTECACNSEDGSRTVMRLSHRVITKIALEAWQRRSRKIERQPARNEDLRRCRLRAKLREIGAPHMAAAPQMLDAVLAELGDDRMTEAAVRAAAEAVSLRT